MSDLSNSNNFYIYGRNDLKDSSNATPWNIEDLPLITHWDGSNWNTMEMGSGDSVTFMLIYDSTRTQTIGGFTTKYTARIINKQS